MRRQVLRAVVLAVLAVAPVLATGLPAHACSCVPYGTLEDDVAEAELAFEGEAVERLAGGYLRVRVDRVFRGTVGASAKIRVLDPERSTCGVRVALGRIVYVGDDDLSLHLCSRTRHGPAAREADTSGLDGRPPGSASPSPSGTAPTATAVPLAGGGDGAGLLPVAAAWTLGAAAVAAVATAFVRRRRRAG